MPLFRKRQAAGSGGGIPSVTLVHDDGSSDVFQPATDSNADRGAAFILAIAAFAAGDLIVLGTGTFTMAITDVTSLNLTGYGQSTIVEGAAISALRLVAGTSSISNLTIKGGVPMAGGSLNTKGVRIEGASGTSAIVRTGAVGSASLVNTHLKTSGGATESIASGGSAFTVNTQGVTANVVPDADVALTTPEGFSVNANYA